MPAWIRLSATPPGSDAVKEVQVLAYCRAASPEKFSDGSEH